MFLLNINNNVGDIVDVVNYIAYNTNFINVLSLLSAKLKFVGEIYYK